MHAVYTLRLFLKGGKFVAVQVDQFFWSDNLLEDNHSLFEWWILSHNDDEQESNYHFKICAAVSMKLWQEKMRERERESQFSAEPPTPKTHNLISGPQCFGDRYWKERECWYSPSLVGKLKRACEWVSKVGNSWGKRKQECVGTQVISIFFLKCVLVLFSSITQTSGYVRWNSTRHSYFHISSWLMR